MSDKLGLHMNISSSGSSVSRPLRLLDQRRIDGLRGAARIL